MNKNTSKAIKITKKGNRKALAFVFGVFMFFPFVSANICQGYVTPDWEAQIKANERQKVHSAPIVVNVKKELKANKKQKAKNQVKVDKKAQKKANKKQKASQKVKVDKKAQKKNNKKQESKSKPYKYSLKAEKQKNALQKVK
jgi:hypothetical protein